MEKFSAKDQKTNTHSSAMPRANTQETFSQMATATASKSGVVGKLLVLSLIVVSVAVTAFVGYAIFSGINAEETTFVDENKYQAVFLPGDQVFFGKITDLDPEGDFIELKDIYYLQVNQPLDQNQEREDEESPAADISLAKRGGLLHNPEDQMLIERDQIIFWENLKDDSAVTKAINAYNNQPEGTN